MEAKKTKSKSPEVDSLVDLHEAVKQARENLKAKDDEELWFRGVSSNKYELMPSLLRYFKDLKEKERQKKLGYLETDLFFEFLAKARTGNEAALDHWDVLFLMQHYRAPTRLLDWTEILHVALYFAVAYPKPDKDEIPRLYVMNPYLWNQEHWGERDLFWPRYFGYDRNYFWEYGEILTEGGVDWENPVALYPPQRDVRLSAQRGYFTLHGYNLKPLEEISPKLIAAVDLGKNAVEEIKEELERSGTNEFTLFPDLEGLSRYLKKKYKLDK